MKILVDIRPLTDKQYSGVGEYTFQLLRALFKIDQKNEYILWYNAFSDVSEHLPHFDHPNVRFVRTRWPNKLFNYACLWLLRRPRLDRLVGEKIDVFFMPHLQFAAVSPRVKSVIALHDLSFLIHPEFFSWRKNVWHWFINVRGLLKRFSTTVAVSEHTKKDAVEIAGLRPERSAVVYSGIDENFKKLDSSDPGIKRIKEKYHLDKPFILFLATLEPRKNVESLIKAFEELKSDSRHADLQLVLAGGRGWKAGPIFKAIEDSEVKQDIIILDYIDALDRAFLYNAASVFAYPSFYEGFGFPPLEAMASGLPVIVGAASSLPEIIGDAGILIDPYNSTALRLALEQILNDPDLAAELSQKGQERAVQFSWEKAAKEYLKIFES